MHRPRIGLVGPDRAQPCGIAEYAERLAAALAGLCDLVSVPYRDALAGTALAECRAILAHYERSLVPDADYTLRLGRRFPGRVFLVPHEVYEADPFAFPYAALASAFPPALWAKRALYRWRHRDYAREQRLQKSGYGAHRVIPLSGPNADILRARAPGKVLDPVPLACYAPPEGTLLRDGAGPFPEGPLYGGPASHGASPGGTLSGTPPAPGLLPRRPRAVIGIFGFLNPATDYSLAFDLLAALDPGVSLLIMGGSRTGPDARPRLEGEAAARGLGTRVRITGWLPPQQVDAHLGLCDLFLAPLRFKSNSASLLRLLRLGKPILAADLPLTRWLRSEGAPLDLFGDARQMREIAAAYLEGRAHPPANRYPWDFPSVAKAYLEAMGVNQ
jgi:hypothetical protein